MPEIPPRCPSCGCNNVYTIATDERFGREYRRRKCRNCANEWRSCHKIKPTYPPARKPAPDPPAAATCFRTRVRCPLCSERGRVTSPRPAQGFRYMKCSVCGHTWKDVALPAR